MRLSNFILQNLEAILQEWEDFAASLVINGKSMDKVVLRDHVKRILETIASDIAQPESEQDEIEKSKGHDNSQESDNTAATSHGKERLALGFSLDAALAEYRALRASVIRLWQKSIRDQPLSDSEMEDSIRFNEAVDQSINESVTSYSSEKERQMRVFDTILSFLPDISFIFTLDGRFSYANKALLELLSMSPVDLIGKNVFELSLPNAGELQRHIAEVIKTQKQFRGETSITDTHRNLRHFEYVFVPALDNAGLVEAIAGTAHDITERKKREDLNWQQANFDQLTGLPNRRLFLDRLALEVKNAARTGAYTALFFIDLDHFKEVNDQYGHDAGDQLLRLVTVRLRSCVRETDMVSRLGGDEFTVILQDLDGTPNIDMVAEKILAEMSKPFQVRGNKVRITVSIGIAVCPYDGATPEILVTNADHAMYLAKNAGRNHLQFFKSDPATLNLGVK